MERPTSAGQGIRDLAAAQPWVGVEQNEDAVLQMLVDSHQPLKGLCRGSSSSPRPPLHPPMREAGAERRSGRRLANTRDRSFIYAMAKDSSLTENEKNQI